MCGPITKKVENPLLLHQKRFVSSVTECVRKRAAKETSECCMSFVNAQCRTPTLLHVTSFAESPKKKEAEKVELENWAISSHFKIWGAFFKSEAFVFLQFSEGRYGIEWRS